MISFFISLTPSGRIENRLKWTQIDFNKDTLTEEGILTEEDALTEEDTLMEADILIEGTL